ncbi:MAG: GldG family protein, partial [Clostridiales Family XIII bacterium]|nr:GldG family protein [Clostridiales Family XIII bacterium]
LIAPIERFFDGSLSLTGVVYYLSLIALFLFLTIQTIQKRRWDASVKKIRTGVFSLGFIATGVALAVAVNLVAGALPSAVTSIDVTPGNIYSLTSQTKNYLDDLEDDVTIYAINAESGMDTTVAATLRDYTDASKHISVEYKDPLVSPTFYQQYTDEQISQGSLIVVCGDVSRVIDYNSLYVTEYDYETYASNVTGYDAEGLITSAIQYVVNDELPKIYELTGHGETQLAGNFASAISKANFTTEQISLLNNDAVPDDARALIINGPTSDLSESDAEKLSAWLDAGGNVVVAFNYEAMDELPNLEAVVGDFGINVVPGLVVKSDMDKYYQQPIYLLPTIGANEYTASLEQSFVFAPYVRGFLHNETEDGATENAADSTDSVEESETEYLTILSTGEGAFSKINIDEATTLDYEDGDITGPFDIAIAAEKIVGDAQVARLVVFGSFLILSDGADEMVSGANSTLLSNTLSAFADADETDIVVVPIKNYNISSLVVSSAVAVGIGIFYIAVIPLVLLVLGIVVWIRRKRA